MGGGIACCPRPGRGAAVLALLAALAWGLIAGQSATAALPDGRGWEMVSPVDKNGGQIEPFGVPFGVIASGGVLQAAADGASVTYGSFASFGAGASGAPPASQYISRRGVGGWSTQNISAPLYSGSYDMGNGGAPYRLFAADLARGLLLNGRHCRGDAEGCAVPNPPLAGTGAPAGYQNYYLRDSAVGSFEALLGAGDVAETQLSPAQFDLHFAGASADLRHVALSTCAALTPGAVEMAGIDGCVSSAPNLYVWSASTGLRLVNDLSPLTVVSPGALAAKSGAISADGERIYWVNLGDGGDLYLNESGPSRLVAGGGGGEPTFETATPDGSIAFYTMAGHLYRYETSTQSSADLTPSGGVIGVLGASDDGDYIYYLTASGLVLRHGATTTQVALTADSSNYPPATGTARVSADGTRLAFVSTVSLTGYDNTDVKTGKPDPQVYLYRDGAGVPLICASCNPDDGRPLGPSSIPGAIANGQGPDATQAYKPRVLSADGNRLFFDSLDALDVLDTNNDDDVYQWEAQGTGSCTKAPGCVNLISSGKAQGGALFVDASQDGSDAFFLTDGSLVGADPGSVDLYDARIGGGFPEPPAPIPCEGDDCQGLQSEPKDPTLTTLVTGPGNPRVRFHHYQRKKGRHHGKRGHHKKRGHDKGSHGQGARAGGKR